MTTKDPLQDGKSSVALLDYMGDDLMVVNAARVSMHKESEWDFVRQVDGEVLEKMLAWKDAKLLKYLATHNHWTPFSHPQIQFRIKMPIVIARQWYKHMIGLTRNEVSRRYVSDVPEIYIPKEWRKAAENIKQGSSEELVSKLTYSTSNGLQSARGEMNRAVVLYNAMIEGGVCPEQARMVLPQSMYTEFIETGSLAAYARIAKLRLDSHSQKEIRWYAQAVNDLIEPLFPVSWKALTN